MSEIESNEGEETTPQEASNLTEDIAKFQEKKQAVKEKRTKEKSSLKKQNKPTKSKEIDMTYLNDFKGKVMKEFNLTDRVDGVGHHCLYYNGLLIAKLLPRKKGWYGVCREVPEKDNIWKAFRVYNTDDETIHYNHIKELVRINSQQEG